MTLSKNTANSIESLLRLPFHVFLLCWYSFSKMVRAEKEQAEKDYKETMAENGYSDFDTAPATMSMPDYSSDYDME